MIESIYDIFRRHPRISIDSRDVDSGSIFFALRGDSFDGNDFAEKALAGGAAYAVVDREEVAKISPKMIYVEDVLSTLQRLATHHRRQLAIPIIAITGSNGKTTTKELLTAVLSQKYRTSATLGNRNNHIGVPLTLLEMTPTTEIGVVEMGANAVGNIAELCEIAEPNYGIINNIGRAHLEGFGGEEGIRRGKGELYDYLCDHDSTAFVAQDDPTLMEMSRQRTGLNTIEYPFALSRGFRHQLEGEYNLKNIASAVALATYFRVESEDIKSAIEGYVPQNNRSQRCETPHNTLIIDCYNANPSSMEASIRNFLGEDFAREKSLILGDMFELGEWSEAEHQRVIELALGSHSARVIVIGKNFSSALRSMELKGEKITSFTSRQEAERELTQNPIRGSAVLIKGSRGVGLENVVRLL